MRKFLLLLLTMFFASVSWSQTITINGGGATNTSGSGNDPIDDYYAYMRYQTVYTAAELTSAGLVAYNELTGLGFSVTESPGSLANYTIRIGHTSATNASAHISSSSTLVKPSFSYTPTVVAAGSYDMITFSTNFVWNGTDNIFIEICTGSNPYASPYGGVRADSKTSGSRSVRSDGSSQCAVNTSSANSNRPVIRFSYITGTPPSCLPPTAPIGSATSTTTANISWTAATPPPSNDYEYAVTTSATPPVSGTAFAGVSTSVSSLTANTTYYLHVRSNCGGGGFSTWATSAAFTTPCDAINIPYTENFNSVTVPAIPSCTKVLQGGSGNLWTTAANPAANGFTSQVLRYAYNSSNAANTWWFTQGLNLTAGTSYRLTYNYGNNSASFTEKLKVAYGNAATIGGMTTTLADHTTINQANIQSNTIDFTPASSGVYYFGFQAYSISNQYNLYLDNVSVTLTPSCIAPTAPIGSATSTTTANISWTAPSPAPGIGYQYAVTTSATPPVIGTDEAGVSTSVSGLTANTTYYLHVRSVCGVGDTSVWVTSAAFTTPCNAANVPFFEGFETGFTDQTAVANCWSQSSVSGSEIWTANSTLTSYNRAAKTGTFNAYLRYGNERWLFYPINLTGGKAYQFKVYARQDDVTPSDASITLAYGSSATPAGMTNIVVNSFNIVNGSYQEVKGFFTPLSSGVYYIGIKGYISGNPWYLSLDDISVELAPNCIPPTAITATPTGSTTANISWTAPSPAPGIGYQYAVTTSATPPVIGTDEAGVSTSVSGLTGNTTYYLHVRSVCGVGDTSVWAAPTSFVTPVTTAIPWSETFPTATLPTGWAVSSYSGPSTVGALNSGTTTNYMYKNLYSAATTGYFTTVSVGVVTGSEMLSFNYRTADYDAPNNPPAAGSGNFVVAISTDYGASYTTLETVVNDGIAGWKSKSYSLSAYTGSYVKIKITGNWISGDYYLGFDDFQIGAACTAPTAQATSLNLTPSTTTVSGTFTAASPVADGYLVVRTTGVPPTNPVDGTTYTAGQSALGGVIVASGSSTSFTATGLTPGTGYTFYVYSYNNTGCVGIAYLTASPLSGSTTTTSAYVSVQSGAWDNPTTWDLNAVPTGNDATIASGHTVTINGAAASAGVVTVNSGGTLEVTGNTLSALSISNSGILNLTGGTATISGTTGSGITNNSGATFNVNGGTINLGPAGGGDRTFTNNGTLNVSSGSLTINGNYSQITSTGSIAQVGGDIIVDGNAAGVLVNSVPSGTYIFQVGNSSNPATSAKLALSGGTITIVDPHASATATHSVYIYVGSSFSATGTHTFKFGDGVSTDAGGNTNGFYTYTYPGSYYAMNNVIVDAVSGTNRTFTHYLYANRIGGDLTITSGELLNNYGLYVNGNIVNNAIFTNSSTLYLSNYTTGSVLASTNAQTISGAGMYRNAQSSPTANFAGLSVNNTNASGITFGSGINSPSFSNTLTVTNGKVNANAINLNGTTSIALTAATSIINTGNLTHNTAGGVAVSGSGFLNVSGSFAFGNVDSRTFTTGGRLVLKSTATGTARIADITNGGVNSGNAISGDISQERYIPAKAARKWILLSSPVSQSVANSWQQQIHVTGAGTGGTVCPTLTTNSNGFDATVSNSPNVYSYNAANAQGSRWTALAATTTNVGQGVGFRVNVRGDRSIGCSLLDGTPAGLVPSAVTLKASGALSAAQKNMGSFTITYPNAGVNNYVLIGNPYPSAITFSGLQASNGATISSTYAIYIPASNTGIYSYWDDNVGEFTGGTGYDNATGNIIANGQAIFVQSSIAGDITLNFTEAQKTTETNTGYFRTPRVFNEKLKVSYLQNNNKVDEVVIRYANDAAVSNTELGKFDITSMNTGTYISSLKATKGMAVQTRDLKTLSNDEVWLNIGATESGTYQLNFSEFENFGVAEIFLKDHYTNTTQNIKQNDTYEFNVDKDNAATKGSARFSVVFNRTTNPVYVTNMIKMYPNPANKQVTFELPQTADNTISYSIKVTDLAGKVVMQQKANGGTHQLTIDKLTTGTYFVEVIDSKGKRTTDKLIKN